MTCSTPSHPPCSSWRPTDATTKPKGISTSAHPSPPVTALRKPHCLPRAVSRESATRTTTDGSGRFVSRQQTCTRTVPKRKCSCAPQSRSSTVHLQALVPC
jgi:hypothetical protein